MRKIASLCSIVLAIGLLLIQSVGAVAHQQKPARLALLIDVTSFEKPADPTQQIPILGNAVDEQTDIREMSKVLQARGFQITALKNGQASRQQILDALDKIVQTAKPEDTVVFYFSGHGATGKEEFSLCPYDALLKSAANDIRESDLKVWLDKLKARNVTLILDCCFSSMETGGRPLKPEYKQKFIGTREEGDVSGQEVHIAPERAVILSGASPKGTALHTTPRPGEWMGLFTYELAKELQKSQNDPTMSYKTLMANVKRNVQSWLIYVKPVDEKTGMSITQTPTVYGSPALVERPLFGQVAPKNMPAWTPTSTVVDRVADNGNAVVPGDVADGLTKGSKVNFVGADGKSVGTGVISKVITGDTKGNTEVTPDPGVDLKALKDSGQPIGVTVVKINNPLTPQGAISVYLEGDEAFQTPVAKSLSSFEFLTIVKDKSAARLIIKGSKQPDGLTGTMLMGPDGESNIDPRGRVFAGKDADALVAQLSTQLHQLGALVAIGKLQNPTRPLRVTLESDKPQYIEQDLAHFVCKSDQDCYVFLYVLDDTGFPGLLWPVRETDDNLLRKGLPLNLPPPPVAGRKLTYPVIRPFGTLKVTALAVRDKAQADKIRSWLLMGKKPDGAEAVGSQHGIGAFEDVQELQIGSPDSWTLSTLVVSTLSKDEANQAVKKP